MQYNTIQYNTIQYNTIQYNTTQYSTIQHNTLQHNTIQYNTIQYNTIQYNTIQYNTIQYNTIQYKKHRTTQDKIQIKKDQKEIKYEFFYQSSTNQNHFSEKIKKILPSKKLKILFLFRNRINQQEVR